MNINLLNSEINLIQLAALNSGSEYIATKFFGIEDGGYAVTFFLSIEGKSEDEKWTIWDKMIAGLEGITGKLIDHEGSYEGSSVIVFFITWADQDLL